MTQAAPPPAPAPESADDQGLHEAARREKLKKLIELGVDPWGGRFDDRTLIGDIRARRGEIRFVTEIGGPIEVPDREAQPELDFRGWMQDQGKGEWTGPKVRAAGRIVLSRDAGKLRFINIQDWTGNIQLFIGKSQVGDESWALAECFDLGDIIGVDGELALHEDRRADDLRREAALPDQEHRAAAGQARRPGRSRAAAADAVSRPGLHRRRAASGSCSRTKVVQSIRSTLNQQGFCEIEGPTLHAIAGGAAARPFITHHNTLDIQLFLRIALELHLKRLLVGGMERVYELGRVYRNEGISPRHNPEFTMLEVYQAFGDYGSMMDLTEAIIADAIEAIDGNYQAAVGRDGDRLHAAVRPQDVRRAVRSEHTGVDPRDAAGVKTLAEKIGFDTAGKHPDVIKSEVFEEKVEDALDGPDLRDRLSGQHLPAHQAEDERTRRSPSGSSCSSKAWKSPTPTPS